MLTHNTLQRARRLQYQTPGYSPPYRPIGKPTGKRILRVKLSLIETIDGDIQIHKE